MAVVVVFVGGMIAVNLESLQDALRQQPFRPFRLFVSDGATYDVPHPDLCMAGPRIAIIGIPPPGTAAPVLDRFAVVDLVHVTRLEPLDSAKATGNGQ